MSAAPGISRRRFFQLAGGGVVVFVGLGSLTALSQTAKFIYPEDFHAYLVIGKDGPGAPDTDVAGFQKARRAEGQPAGQGRHRFCPWPTTPQRQLWHAFQGSNNCASGGR